MRRSRVLADKARWHERILAGFMAVLICLVASASGAAEPYSVILGDSWRQVDFANGRQVWQQKHGGGATFSIFTLKTSSQERMPAAEAPKNADQSRRASFDRFKTERKAKLGRLGIQDWTVVRHENNKIVTAKKRVLPGVLMEGSYRAPSGSDVCFVEWQVSDEGARKIYQVTVTEKTSGPCGWPGMRRNLQAFKINE